METLTASVIIVVVFMISSFSFNNVFVNTIRYDEELLKNRLNEVEYFTKHNKIEFPFFEEQDYWVISGRKNKTGAQFIITNTKSSQNYTVEMVSE